MATLNLTVVNDTTNYDNSSDVEPELTHGSVALDYFLLVLPFIFIPISIIFFRLVRYTFKIISAKTKGKGDDLLKDPLAELGFASNSGFTKSRQIKKIRSDIERYKKMTEFKIDAIQEEEIVGFLEKDRDAVAAVKEENAITNQPKKNDIRTKADQYFKEIQLQTRRTWSEKISPDAVKRFLGTTRYGRMWMFFQVACTSVSIINYILLTYGIGNESKKNVKRLDVILASVFMVDYLIGLYTSDDRLKFYFNFSSLIDLLSIVPTFVYVLFVSDSSPQIAFVGLLRILRASRILRTYRLISFSETEERRELTILALTFINFLFLSASIINAFEVIQDTVGIVKTPPSLEAWHDCLYYIMITFSTIGFGDLTPQSVMSRVLVMCLVVLVVIFVPLQTGKLAELYNSTNKYERARYTPNPNNAHVILSGVITYSAIIDFCREYFVNDPTGHVVILAADPPTLELRRLMRHPYYKNRVHFLCGSPLSTPDLKRCAAQQATGIFLLNQESSEGNSGGEDEQLKVTRGADAEILMQALVIKGGFQGLLIFAEVQDIRTQDLSDTCGCDQTLCLDELKMTLLARNCAVPGVLTLIMNLVHSYKESEDDFEEAWMQEYHYGASNQMQSFKFPPALINRSFGEVYKLLYSAFGLTLFAVINRSGKFILNPGKSYMIKSDDNGICIFHGGDEVLLRLAILFESGHTDLKTIPTMYNREKISQYVKKRFSTTVIQSIGGGGSSSHSNNNTSNDTNSSGVIDGISVTGNTIEVITGDKDVQVVEFQDDQSTTQVIIKSGSLQPDINIASPTSTNTMAAQFDPTSSDAESEITMQALQRPAPKNFSLHHQQEHYSSSSTFQNHIILCGNMTARGIRHFVQTVRSSERNITTQSNTMPIVCLLENVPSVITGIWEDIMKFPKVHLICGTPLKKTNLLNAGIEKCHRIMIFAKKTEVKIGNSDTNSIPDANSIFIVQMIQEEWPTTKFIVELLNGSNARYFSIRDQNINLVNLKMKSILTNYSLSISDRLVLYKKLRTSTGEGMIKKVIYLATGSEFKGFRKGKPGSDQMGAGQTVADIRRSVSSRQAAQQPLLGSTSGSSGGGGGGGGGEAGGGKKNKYIPLVDQGGGDGSGSGSSKGGSNGGEQAPLTNAYLQKLENEAELNETGLSPFPVYHFDKHFAAGMISTSSFSHSLLCQSYFRPFLINTVKLMMNKVVQQSIPPGFEGRKFVELAEYLLENCDGIPIGLYRRVDITTTTTTTTATSTTYGTSFSSSSRKYHHNNAVPLPYVYTNPRWDDEVRKEDHIYVLPN